MANFPSTQTRHDPEFYAKLRWLDARDKKKMKKQKAPKHILDDIKILKLVLADPISEKTKKKVSAQIANLKKKYEI